MWNVRGDQLLVDEELDDTLSGGVKLSIEGQGYFPLAVRRVCRIDLLLLNFLVKMEEARHVM